MCFVFSRKKYMYRSSQSVSLVHEKPVNNRSRLTGRILLKSYRSHFLKWSTVDMHSFDLDMHSILSIFASNTSVTTPTDDLCPSLSNLTEFLQDAQSFLLLLAQIEEIGWTAIQLSSSADGSTLTLHHTYIDLGDRLHDLYMDISLRRPNERPHCRTHLPVEFSIESWSGKTSRLIEVINNFHSIVDSLQPFWAQLAEIERDAIVLDEKPISYASTMRRLKINDHVHVQIQVSEWVNRSSSPRSRTSRSIHSILRRSLRWHSMAHPCSFARSTNVWKRIVIIGTRHIRILSWTSNKSSTLPFPVTSSSKPNLRPTMIISRNVASAMNRLWIWTEQRSIAKHRTATSSIMRSAGQVGWERKFRNEAVVKFLISS